MNKKKDMLTLVKDGVTEYKIRIAAPMEPISNELEVAQAIQRLFAVIAGVSPEIATAAGDNEVPYEILIGKTCRENDNFVVDRSGMDGDDCALVMGNHKIVFAAVTDDGLWACAARFASRFLGYDVETMKEVTPTSTIACRLPAFTEVGNGDIPYRAMLADNVREAVGATDGTVCFSSPAVYERLRAYARGMAPSRHRKVRLVLNSAVAPCTCPTCSAVAEEEGTPNGAYFRAVAKIAEELLPLWPEQRVQIAACNETLRAPSALKFPDNVDVLVCAPKLSSAYAVNDSASKVNRAFAKNLKKWTSVARVQVIDFTSDYYYFPATFPNLFTVRENLNYYASIGVNGCYLQWNTVQASLEFGPVRKKLYRDLLDNPTMSEEQYRALLQKHLETVFGAHKAEDLLTYIELMDAASAQDYTVTDRPASVIPVKVTESAGKRTYDLSVMTEAYSIWDRVHPYHENMARSQIYLSQMLFNRYQSKPESHAFVQFSEWFTDAIDNFDKTDVLNEIFAAVDAMKTEE